ncbi:MAG: hypothetical protein AB4352_16370 [Hormoscilla sp.]
MQQNSRVTVCKSGGIYIAVTATIDAPGKIVTTRTISMGSERRKKGKNQTIAPSDTSNNQQIRA